VVLLLEVVRKGPPARAQVHQRYHCALPNANPAFPIMSGRGHFLFSSSLFTDVSFEIGQCLILGCSWVRLRSAYGHCLVMGAHSLHTDVIPCFFFNFRTSPGAGGLMVRQFWKVFFRRFLFPRVRLLSPYMRYSELLFSPTSVSFPFFDGLFFPRAGGCVLEQHNVRLYSPSPEFYPELRAFPVVPTWAGALLEFSAFAFLTFRGVRPWRSFPIPHFFGDLVLRGPGPLFSFRDVVLSQVTMGQGLCFLFLLTGKWAKVFFPWDVIDFPSYYPGKYRRRASACSPQPISSPLFVGLFKPRSRA